MILAVCLNPALDITYRADAVRPGSSHSVTVTGERAGGKGINVARVLRQMGVATTVTGLLGGARGDRLAAELDAAGLPHAFESVAGQSRRSIAVVDADDATVFNEVGPSVTAAEWERFRARYCNLLTGAAAVTLSGSTPPGPGAGAYARLVRLAVDAGVPVVLDAGGTALTQALEQRPTLVAPNRTETVEALGRGIDGRAELASAAAELRALGAQSVVISSGPDGLVCRSAHGGWVATPSHRVRGNPTGAGDALTAALAVGLVNGWSWPATLRTGLGWAAGAAAAEHAGEIDESVAARVARESVLEELG